MRGLSYSRVCLTILREDNDEPDPSPNRFSGTLVDILEETAARYPERWHFPCRVGGHLGTEFQSYPELLRNAKEMAQVLYRRGLRPVRR